MKEGNDTQKTIVKAVDFRKIFKNFTSRFCIHGTNRTHLYARSLRVKPAVLVLVLVPGIGT